MTKQRRTFTPEFKREAACLVLDQGYSHAEAARSLGLVESALRRWVNQLQQERGGVTPASKALTPEQQKIQELEARITRLEREKSILKKATALLMSEDLERDGVRLFRHGSRFSSLGSRRSRTSTVVLPRPNAYLRRLTKTEMGGGLAQGKLMLVHVLKD